MKKKIDIKKKINGKNYCLILGSKVLDFFSFLKSPLNGFASQTERFNQPSFTKNNVPGILFINIGPGSYDVNTNAKKALLKMRSQKKDISMFQLYNIPSIPFHESSFGYEESGNGELLRQPTVNDGFTGDKNDSVGPGQYEIKDPLINMHGGNWHISKVNRMGLKVPENELGPGSYNAIYKTSKSFSSLKGTSCFIPSVQKIQPQSSVQLESDEEDDIEPGPGQYNPNTCNQHSNNATQGFGMTGPRFPQTKISKLPTVGPGQYTNFYFVHMK